MNVVTINLDSLFRNPIFLSALFSLMIAQFIKAVITILRVKRIDAKDTMLIFMWRTGGMPSSHSAIAISISSAIAMTEGLSNLFVVSLFLSLIVIRDALGVRRSAGLQSKALNKLGSDLNERYKLEYEPVREVHGHTFPEVFVGAILGLIIALFFCKPW